MVVSHDRAFLERTITAVLELDEHSHEARMFEGGWLAYLDERETTRRHAEEAYADYRSKRGDLESRARQQRQWAVQGVRKATKRPRDNDKAQRDFFLNRTEKQAAKVRVTEKALERLDVVAEPAFIADLQHVAAADVGEHVAHCPLGTRWHRIVWRTGDCRIRELIGHGLELGVVAVVSQAVHRPILM